ncbi:MAG: hypothetical protein ACC653_12470 [Gammaproteobacteria bacterium]
MKKYKINNLLKIVGLGVFFALLSACHALPVHHSNSHGSSSYGDYDQGSSRHSGRHMHSRDY